MTNIDQTKSAPIEWKCLRDGNDLIGARQIDRINLENGAIRDRTCPRCRCRYRCDRDGATLIGQPEEVTTEYGPGDRYFSYAERIDGLVMELAFVRCYEVLRVTDAQVTSIRAQLIDLMRRDHIEPSKHDTKTIRLKNFKPRRERELLEEMILKNEELIRKAQQANEKIRKRLEEIA